MHKFGRFLIWLVAVLAGIAFFNLLIGVLGLNQAIVTLVIFVVFAIYASFVTQVAPIWKKLRDPLAYFTRNLALD